MEMPVEVRWNSFCESFKSYLKNWPILLEICESHRSTIDRDVLLYVQSLSLKRNVEELVSVMNPIVNAIDQLQKSTCKIAECVYIWSQLKIKLWECSNFNTACKIHFSQRYKMALQPCHFAAFLISPVYLQQFNMLLLQDSEVGTNYIEDDFQISFLPKYYKFKAKLHPFSGALMNEEVINHMTAYEWWRSFIATNPNYLCENEIYKLYQLTNAVCSSADIERVFSSMGLIHSKIRNQLGVEKANKLCFLYKTLNK